MPTLPLPRSTPLSLSFLFLSQSLFRWRSRSLRLTHSTVSLSLFLFLLQQPSPFLASSPLRWFRFAYRVVLDSQFLSTRQRRALACFAVAERKVTCSARFRPTTVSVWTRCLFVVDDVCLLLMMSVVDVYYLLYFIYIYIYKIKVSFKKFVFFSPCFSFFQ